MSGLEPRKRGRKPTVENQQLRRENARLQQSWREPKRSSRSEPASGRSSQRLSCSQPRVQTTVCALVSASARGFLADKYGWHVSRSPMSRFLREIALKPHRVRYSTHRILISPGKQLESLSCMFRRRRARRSLASTRSLAFKRFSANIQRDRLRVRPSRARHRLRRSDSLLRTCSNWVTTLGR